MAAITNFSKNLYALAPDGSILRSLTYHSKKNRIGEYKEMVLVYKTDFNINSQMIVIDVALFQNPSLANPFSGGRPTNNYWSYQVDTLCTAGTYPMALNLQAPYPTELATNNDVSIVITDTKNFTIHYKFYQIYDLNSYINPSLEDNRWKLLKDRQSNASILSVSGSSVYNNSVVVPRMYCWIGLGTMTTAYREDFWIGYAAGFYSKNETQAAPYFIDPEWILENGSAVAVPSILMTENTNVRFRFNTTDADPSYVMVWMIRTSGYDNTQLMKTSYVASHWKVVTDGGTGTLNNKICGPANDLSFVASKWEINFHVDKTLVAVGETYRFIAIPVYDENPDSTELEYEVNSFISDPYTVGVPSFTGEGYEFAGIIEDYQQGFLGNDLVCVIEERLINLAGIAFSGTVFSNDILARLGLTVPNDIRRYLTQITVEVFEQADVHTRHYFDRQTIYKTSPTTYGSTASLFVLNNPTDNVLTKYFHRVRYEDWLPNLQTTYDGVDVGTPMSNMNMAGRTIIVQTAFVLYYDDYGTPFSDTLIFTQTIRPKNYDTALLIQNADGSPLRETYYCNDGELCFRALGLDIPFPYWFISTIEKAPGNIGTIEETEINGAFDDLPQLISAKINSQDGYFDETVAGEADFCLNPAFIAVDWLYKISAIAKQQL